MSASSSQTAHSCSSLQAGRIAPRWIRAWIVTAVVAAAVVAGACTGDAPSPARDDANAPSATTAAVPSPTATETPAPPAWVRDAKTIPNPPISEDTPWLIAAADEDGDQLIVRNTEGASCHNPIRTVLAWYQFAGAAPQTFYTTPNHSQVLQIAANADFVVWTETRMVYQGPPPSQPPCPAIDLPWLRVLVLRRDTGAVVEVDRDDVAAPAGRFVLDGRHLVFAKRQSPGATMSIGWSRWSCGTSRRGRTGRYVAARKACI